MTSLHKKLKVEIFLPLLCKAQASMEICRVNLAYFLYSVTMYFHLAAQ